MPKKRFSAEQIVTLLRQIEVSKAQDKPTPMPSCNYSINWVLAGVDPQWPDLKLRVADFDLSQCGAFCSVYMKYSHCRNDPKRGCSESDWEPRRARRGSLISAFLPRVPTGGSHSSVRALFILPP